MKKSFVFPRGTSDILPEETSIWCALESQARKLLRNYGYCEIRTPLFEETNLFARSVGQTSDIVQKQMLNLAAQGAQTDAEDIQSGSLSLRPEGTASIVRSYIQHNLARKEKLSKLFYIGPMFRGERPQKGRLRQFHQIGVEAIGAGSASSYLDAEVIALSVNLLKDFGVTDFVLKINTLGSIEDKVQFAEYLKDKLSDQVDHLCPDCQNRYGRNIFRLLDCKNKACQKIIHQIEFDFSYLSQESRDYYTVVKAALDILGIAYQEDPCLVRGLDYYTHVVFELCCDKLGSQNALGAGGRYNCLVEQLGGPQVDAIGFALGMERILLASSQESIQLNDRLDAFVVALGDEAFLKAFQLLFALRSNQISADMRFSGDSLKSQMRQANKVNARNVVILGQEEIERGVIVVKNMDEGNQDEVPLEDIQQLMIKLRT